MAWSSVSEFCTPNMCKFSGKKSWAADGMVLSFRLQLYICLFQYFSSPEDNYSNGNSLVGDGDPPPFQMTILQMGVVQLGEVQMGGRPGWILVKQTIVAMEVV